MSSHPEEHQALSTLFAERAQMSQREFGQRFKIGTGPMVWQYLQGNRSLNLRAACKFARGLGVEIARFSPRLADELADMVVGGIGSSVLSGDYEQIRCVTIKCKKGVGSYDVRAAGPASAFIAFRRDWLAAKGYVGSQLLAVQANDNAMQGTFAVGDLLVVNTADRVLEDGCVFAVNYEGQLRMRRVFRDAGYWWLHCDHQDAKRHPRKQFVEKQCFSIGRIVHRQSELI